MSSSSVAFSRPCPKTGYYDVFLSFRGKDTRGGFTNNLYHSLMDNKVYTFMDVKLVGKVIDTLFKIIGRSKMAVVVYSERFASSDWCLRELEMILQRVKDEKMVMIPIFYKVDVHELKHLTGKTAEYLDKHIPEHGEVTVKKWKDAVTTLGKVSGISYKDRYERDFIVEVIKTIKETLDEWEQTIESCMISNDVRNQDKIMVMERPTTEITIEKGLASDKNIEKALKVPQKDRGSSMESFSHTNTTTGEEVYRIVTSAYFQKSGELLTGKLLNINCTRLWFHVEPEKPSSRCFILTNKTDNYVAFMLKMDTEKPQNYSINPNKGVLWPRSTCQVIVTMKAQTVIRANDECKDKFLVQSVKAKKDSYSADDLSNMFTGMLSRYSIDKICMSVHQVAPPPTLNSSVPDHVAQLANKGLVYGTMKVSSIDQHPTKPWLLLGFEYGFVCIWNYETRIEEKSFDGDYWEFALAKFIHEKPWMVVGYRNGSVRVIDYNTSEKVKEFKAHEDLFGCIAVHPTSPYVLTTSADEVVKLWNWENDWACSETFEGHSGYVVDVAFNPKDSTSFASVSWDGTIKIWSFGSSVAKFTIDAHVKGLTCVEYFVGNDNKLYLLSGSYDNTVRVWDYESKALVQTLEGHLCNVTATLVHPKLPIIITASTDKTIRIWNKNTHRFKLVWTSDLGQVWSIRFIQASDEVVLGCDDGMVVIKIIIDAAET